ncbi:MAG: hypothetical protein ACO3HJ_07465 [Methylophilaceae bacterium]
MYLIIFTIVVVVILLLRRERLTLEELEKQIETAEPTLLTQYTRLQYEKRIKDAEAEAKPILESLQNSPGMEIIKKRRRDFDYKQVLDQANLNLQNFIKNHQNQIINVPDLSKGIIRKGFKDPALDARFIELSKQVSKINYEIDKKPLTIDEGIIIEEPQIIENIKNQLKTLGLSVSDLSDDKIKEMAKNVGINTSSRLQQIKDSVADIREQLRKDDELLMELQRKDKEDVIQRRMEEERSLQELIKKTESKETALERMRRVNKEKRISRRKAKAEAEAEAKAKAEEEAKAKAEAEAKAKAEAEAEAKAQKAEETKIKNEEIMKINNAREEAEEVMNQLREIPLEERIRRKIFVQPKLDHKPYPYVRSTPANPPYDTTKYSKRENLFRNSEISSIFPQVKLSNTWGI